MKKLAVSLLALVTHSVFAVEGYQDIYLDREMPVNIHSIYCSKDLKNINGLKAAYIYTNSPHIEEGTYHFSSAYGNFSYTFKALDGKDPKLLLTRGLLSGGKTQKSDMVKELCIVGKIPGLPVKMSKNIGARSIMVSDPEWDQVMRQYAMFGRPAFGKGVFTDSRTLAKQGVHDQKVFDANQAYIEQAKSIFREKAKQTVTELPKQLTTAIQYAHQEDGFLDGKVYPAIKEPQVWTAIAKERYNDQNRQLANQIAWDKVIQDGFDWFFKLTEKSNRFQSAQVVGTGEVTLNGTHLEQLVTVGARFSNGKILELDFLITSQKLPNNVFHSLDEIKQQAIQMRGNMVVGAKKIRDPIVLPKKENFDVFNPVDKVNIFFTSFRHKQLGDTYRYQ